MVVTSTELEDRLAPVYAALRIEPGQLEAMTGIVERRYWEPGFPVWQGAARAAHSALQNSGVSATDLDVLIYGGVCRQYFEPATACHVAAALQRTGSPISPSAAIFDVGNACLGVLNGMLDIANRLELGQIRAGMVVSCETARDIVDAQIEAMLDQPDMERFRFCIASLTGGSGAVAVILTDGSFGGPKRRRLVGAVTESAPEHHMLCRWGMHERPRHGRGGPVLFEQFMSTDSVAVLEHGVALGKRTWSKLLRELDWAGPSIDRFVTHQVGSTHRASILGALEIDAERDFVAYDFLGNTGTEALPIADGLAQEREFLQPGHRVGLLGIGSGLSCMMMGVEW